MTSDANGDSMESSLNISSDCLSLGRAWKSSRDMTPPPPSMATITAPSSWLTVELSLSPSDELQEREKIYKLKKRLEDLQVFPPNHVGVRKDLVM